jgi:hypothetical protein
MAHIYDKDGNYQGEIISDHERWERTKATFGCLGMGLLLLIFLYPVFLTVYYLLGNENNRIEDAYGDDEKIGCLSLPLIFFVTLTTPTSDDLTEAEKRYKKRVMNALMITIALFILYILYI